MTTMTLGQSIRYMRQTRGLTQADLAKRLGISPCYLSLIEGDHREATIPLLRNMADQLGSPAWLVFALALAGTEDLRAELLCSGPAQEILDSMSKAAVELGDGAEVA